MNLSQQYLQIRKVTLSTKAVIQVVFTRNALKIVIWSLKKFPDSNFNISELLPSYTFLT